MRREREYENEFRAKYGSKYVRILPLAKKGFIMSSLETLLQKS